MQKLQELHRVLARVLSYLEMEDALASKARSTFVVSRSLSLSL